MSRIQIRLKNMMTVDVANHFVAYTPDGKLLHFRLPAALNILGALEPVDITGRAPQDHVRKALAKYLQTDEFDVTDEGVWYNVRATDGTLEHPFTGEKLSGNPALHWSNYLDSNWRKWYPIRVRRKLADLGAEISDLQRKLNPLLALQQELEGGDYSEEKS